MHSTTMALPAAWNGGVPKESFLILLGQFRGLGFRGLGFRGLGDSVRQNINPTRFLNKAISSCLGSMKAKC